MTETYIIRRPEIPFRWFLRDRWYVQGSDGKVLAAIRVRPCPWLKYVVSVGKRELLIPAVIPQLHSGPESRYLSAPLLENGQVVLSVALESRPNAGGLRYGQLTFAYKGNSYSMNVREGQWCPESVELEKDGQILASAKGAGMDPGRFYCERWPEVCGSAALDSALILMVVLVFRRLELVLYPTP